MDERQRSSRSGIASWPKLGNAAEGDATLRGPSRSAPRRRFKRLDGDAMPSDDGHEPVKRKPATQECDPPGITGRVCDGLSRRRRSEEHTSELQSQSNLLFPPF